MEKKEIQNAIILDKSGSMSSISCQAVDSVNEVLGSIRSAAKNDPTIDQIVTLVAFCGCERKVLIDRKNINDVENITYDQYRPCCTTPLYDAIGFTIRDIHKAMGENSAASVTIITDGYENSSTEFSGADIKALINSYKEEGWLFAYIGADHDVEAVAFNLSIDNTLKFEKTDAGVHEMSDSLTRSMHNWRGQVSCCLEADMSPEERKKSLKEKAKDFFKC